MLMLMLVDEGRRVEDTDGGVVMGVEQGGDASVGSDMLDVLTRDAPADKRLISRSWASSGVKVEVTVGSVAVSYGPPKDTVIITGVVVGVGGGVVSVEFRVGSGTVEFDPSVDTIPPCPPAPLIIERALDSEVHPTN